MALCPCCKNEFDELVSQKGIINKITEQYHLITFEIPVCEYCADDLAEEVYQKLGVNPYSRF